MVIFHGTSQKKVKKKNDSEKILVKMMVDTTFRGISPPNTVMIERTRMIFFTAAVHTKVLHPKKISSERVFIEMDNVHLTSKFGCFLGTSYNKNGIPTHLKGLPSLELT